MTHKQKVLRLLSDRKPHSHHESPCVLWTGYISNKDGYGRKGPQKHRGGAPELAHRWTVEQALGEKIPAGLEVHHRCGVRACVNLAHLQLVDRLEHRSIERRERTHCHRGHPYATYGRNHKGRNAIYCTECKRITDRAKRVAA